jgi:helix-turn-helix protein
MRRARSDVAAFDPIHVPEWAWRQETTRQVLRNRDVAGILKVAQQYGGASQHRLAVAVGILQGRLSEILSGHRRVTAFDVFERIADGLGMPDEARRDLGLAPRATPELVAPRCGDIDRVYASQADVSADLRTTIAGARTLDLVVARGLSLIGITDAILRSAVVGAFPKMRVRVLLLDPVSRAVRCRADELGESPTSLATGIRLCLHSLEKLAIDAELSVYLYDELPVWRLIRIDQVLYASSYASRRSGPHTPIYKLTGAVDGGLHAGLQRAIDELAARSRKVI